MKKYYDYKFSKLIFALYLLVAVLLCVNITQNIYHLVIPDAGDVATKIMYIVLNSVFLLVILAMLFHAKYRISDKTIQLKMFIFSLANIEIENIFKVQWFKSNGEFFIVYKKGTKVYTHLLSTDKKHFSSIIKTLKSLNDKILFVEKD